MVLNARGRWMVKGGWRWVEVHVEDDGCLGSEGWRRVAGGRCEHRRRKIERQ